MSSDEETVVAIVSDIKISSPPCYDILEVADTPAGPTKECVGWERCRCIEKKEALTPFLQASWW